MSVCAERRDAAGASRAESSAWSARCTAAGSRRQPKVTPCSSGSSPTARASRDEHARRERDVVRRAVHDRAETEPVREREPGADRVPEPGLHRHERSARPQQPRRLLEHRRERPLVHDVVEHEPVQDDVEGARLVGQLARPAGHAVVELAALDAARRSSPRRGPRRSCGTRARGNRCRPGCQPQPTDSTSPPRSGRRRSSSARSRRISWS